MHRATTKGMGSAFADRAVSIRWKAGSAGIGFSERTSGRDCIGEMVEDRLSIPSILSTWWFLPRRNGCTDSVAEIRFEDPFSSGINVTGRCP